MLCPRRHLHLVLATDGGHGDPVPEHRLGHAHGQLVEQVLAAPHQVFVRGDPEADVEIAARPAARTGLALARLATGQVLVDPRRDGDVQLLALVDPALAAAARAGLFDDPALAAAARARGDIDHLAEDALHGAPDLAAATAVGTLRRLRAGSRPAAGAVRARPLARHLDGAAGSEHGLREGDVDVHAQVGARLRTTAAAPAAARATTEEHVEEVEGGVEREATEIGLREGDVAVHAQVGARLRPTAAAPAAARATTEEHVEEVEGGVEREATEVRHAVAGVPVGVVALPLLRVAEHRVGLTDLLEALLGRLVALVAIRMELHRQLAIGALQLLRRGGALDAEHLVVVALHRRHD